MSSSAEVGCRVLAAEVDAAGELADDEQVGALDPLPPQRAGVDQGGLRLDRPQVRVQPEALAQAEQALLRARGVGIGGVPLRPADGAEQHRVGGAAGVESLVGQGAPVSSIEMPPISCSSYSKVPIRVEDPAGGGDDLGADPVAGQDDDPRGFRLLRHFARGTVSLTGAMPDRVAPPGQDFQFGCT